MANEQEKGGAPAEGKPEKQPKAEKPAGEAKPKGEGKPKGDGGGKPKGDAKGGGGGKKGGKGGKGEPAKMPTTPPRLKVRYEQEVLPELQKQFGLKNKHQLPKPVKVVINMGVGEAHENKNLLTTLVEHMDAIAGQKAVITKARLAIAAFKIREGYPVGCRVTLRKQRMWYFLDKLISLALPRVRDFRGVNPDAFDKAGNYSLGLTEQGLFPEINMDRVETNEIHGMNITIVFANSDPSRSREALNRLGMPFRREAAAGAKGA